MTLFRKGRASRKAAGIGILLFLTAYQWISLFRFHSQEHYVSPPEFEPPMKSGQKPSYTAIREQSEPRHPQSLDVEVMNEVIHRAFFGLGHRLHRSAAVYHLAQSLSLSRNQTYSVSQTNRDQVDYRPRITHFRFHWESCLSEDEILNASAVVDVEKEYNVFRYLFGDDVWKLNFEGDPPPASQKSPLAMKNSDTNIGRDAKPQIRRNMLVIRNDVPGYVAGQLYKDLQLPVSYRNKGELVLQTPMSSFTQYEAIVDKVMRSDVEFYQRLVDTYQFQKELREFQQKHRWRERPFVVGLHLRSGNGEENHFKESGRESSRDVDETTMIARLIQLINKAVTHETRRIEDQNRDPVQQGQALRPLLFVATDTAHLLPLIDKMASQGTEKDDSGENEPTQTTPGMFDVVTWPQYRLPQNAGVTFDTLQGKGEECLQGWRSAMSDALLLSSVDMLIAAKRSTFTQSLPLTLGFGRNHKENYSNRAKDAILADIKHDKNLDNKSMIRRNNGFSFCEVSESDFDVVTCFADAKTWLFRGSNDKIDQISQNASQGDPRREENIWSFSVAESKSGDPDHQVQHKITVLLPDIDPPSEFNRAQDFLRRKNNISELSIDTGTEIDESVFRYGRSKINQKYRNSHQMTPKTNESGWNFVFNPDL